MHIGWLAQNRLHTFSISRLAHKRQRIVPSACVHITDKRIVPSAVVHTTDTFVPSAGVHTTDYMIARSVSYV